MWNKETGERIAVSLKGTDLQTGSPDLYRLSRDPEILDRMIAVADNKSHRPPLASPLPQGERGLPAQSLGPRESSTAKLSQSAATFAGIAAAPLFKFSELFEQFLIDPVVPVVERIKTFGTVAAQEFFSFAILTPAVMGLITYLSHDEPASHGLEWFQYALVGFLSLVVAPIMVQGIEDGFTDSENWEQYFIRDEECVFVKNKWGQLIPDYDQWKFRLFILAHAFLYGGLVRSAKVAAALFPKEIPVIKDIPSEMIPKTLGEWAGFGTELATDILLYLIYFGVYALSEWTFEMDLAFKVTWISALAYCFTAPEIGRKYSKYKATWIRQVFSVFKNPAVMIAGSGIFTDGVSIAFISAFSLALWAWAKYGFQGEPELVKHLGRHSDKQPR